MKPIPIQILEQGLVSCDGTEESFSSLIIRHARGHGISFDDLTTDQERLARALNCMSFTAYESRDAVRGDCGLECVNCGSSDLAYIDAIYQRRQIVDFVKEAEGILVVQADAQSCDDGDFGDHLFCNTCNTEQGIPCDVEFLVD